MSDNRTYRLKEVVGTGQPPLSLRDSIKEYLEVTGAIDDTADRILNVKNEDHIPFYTIDEYRTASTFETVIEHLAAFIHDNDWQSSAISPNIHELFLKCKTHGFSTDVSVGIASIALQYHNCECSEFELTQKCIISYIRDEVNGKLDLSLFDMRLSNCQVQFDPRRLMKTVRDVPSVCPSAFQWFSTRSPKTAKEYLEGLYDIDEQVYITDRLVSKVPCYIFNSFHRDPFSLNSFEGGYLMANPVSGIGEFKHTLTNGYSFRSGGCITKYKYLVLQSNCIGYERLWLRFLFQLRLPVVSIVYSGNRSYHALVKVEAETEQEWIDFRNKHIEFLITHGADKYALSPSCLTRLPFCTRSSTGSIQNLIYYNPHADGRSIMDYSCLKEAS